MLGATVSLHLRGGGGVVCVFVVVVVSRFLSQGYNSQSSSCQFFPVTFTEMAITEHLPSGDFVLIVAFIKGTPNDR